MAKLLKKVFKSKEPPMIEEKRVEYEINRHCENCPNEIERCIKKEKGVASVRCLKQVENDEETGQEREKILAIVQGKFDEKRLQKNLRSKTSKTAKIVSSQIVESGGGGGKEDGNNINEGGGGGGGGGDSNSDGKNINEEDDNVSQIGSKIKGVSISSRKGKEITDDNVSEDASISSHGSRASRGSKASKRIDIASSSHVGKSADVGSHQGSP